MFYQKNRLLKSRTPFASSNHRTELSHKTEKINRFTWMSEVLDIYPMTKTLSHMKLTETLTEHPVQVFPPVNSLFMLPSRSNVPLASLHSNN